MSLYQLQPCPLCGSLLHHEDDCHNVITYSMPPTPCPEVPSETAQWIVRRIEGMRRGLFGLFVDQSTRPILKGIKKDELQRIADAHNDSLAAALTRIAELEAENTRLRNPPSA